MLLGNKKTHIAYRCPSCGSGVRGLCGDFALAGGRLLRLRCPCGQSHLEVAPAGDGKLLLTVPCLLCGTAHRFRISESLFYGRDLFLLNCAYSDLDVAFIGDEERVSAALDENEGKLRTMFADAGIAALSANTEEERPTLPDVGVLDIIRFLVRELEADGEIDCPCGNGEYDLELCPDGVRVFCQNCGGEHLFPVSSEEAAQAFLMTDHITLQEKG